MKKENLIPEGFVIDKANSTDTKLVYIKKVLKITDRVKTLKDAITVCKEDSIDISDIIFHDSDTVDEKAYKELKIAVRALNQKWVANLKDKNQRKWYVYYNGSGFGVSYADFDYWFTHTYCGSRLCFKTEALALSTATKHIEIFKEFLTIKK